MLNVALAGLGTIGSGVARLLRQNADLIASRAGKPITIKAVSARNKTKPRDCDLAGIEWVGDPVAMAAMPGIDAVIELIGGAGGVAQEIAETALKSGKHLITANKALLAENGAALARFADKHKVQLSFEAAVAGGIPIIKTMREALAGNNISTVRGILNGTCNYILTEMRDKQLDFAEALKEAQNQGYAETDPSADIDGHDAANKLAILSALAFGSQPDLTSIHVKGIRHITKMDLQFAEDLDCRIKLLGVSRLTKAGLEQHVGPSLVPKTSPLAHVGGVLNAVLLHGDFVGNFMLEGQGAGGNPTASAVVADLIDIARGRFAPAFGILATDLRKISPAQSVAKTRHYMRLQVLDKPGVVADISAILRDEEISIESFIQRGVSPTESVPVVIITHASKHESMRRAAEKIARAATVKEPPCLLPIED